MATLTANSPKTTEQATLFKARGAAIAARLLVHIALHLHAFGRRDSGVFCGSGSRVLVPLHLLYGPA
jgi:hypothetical protein